MWIPALFIIGIGIVGTANAVASGDMVLGVVIGAFAASIAMILVGSEEN